MNSENIIWDTITDSAKTKFDYDSFAKPFLDFDEQIPENILFKVIISLAAKEKAEVISYTILNELIMIGFKVDKSEIDNFIKEKGELLKLEIYCSQLASDMLQNGDDTSFVLKSIKQLLDK